MNVIDNKKGFTLVELLAVIVILAIIILIAATNIGGLTNNSKKDVLAEEGSTLVNGAKLAFPKALMNGEVDENSDSICFDLEELYNTGYFDKGAKDNYYGSVLVKGNSDDENYTYTFWLSNGEYKIDGAEFGATGKIVKNDTSKASSNCNNYAPDIPQAVVKYNALNDNIIVNSNYIYSKILIGSNSVLQNNLSVMINKNDQSNPGNISLNNNQVVVKLNDEIIETRDLVQVRDYNYQPLPDAIVVYSESISSLINNYICTNCTLYITRNGTRITNNSEYLKDDDKLVVSYNKNGEVISEKNITVR